MDPTCRPAISSHSLGRAWVHDLPSKLACAAAAGFQGIEVFHEDLVFHARTLFRLDTSQEPTPSQRIAAARDIRSACDALNLRVVCLQPFRNFEGLQNEQAREARLRDAGTWIAMAHVLATDLIAVASSLLPAEEAIGDPARLAADLAMLADAGAAADPPVRFSYEALCFGTHVTAWQHAADIVRRAARPNLGLCLDTFNIAGYAFADPALPGGERLDGLQKLRESLKELVTTVRPEEVFYVQAVDAERLEHPLNKGHPLYRDNQPSRMSWSRACRLFYGETERGAYMPIREVMSAIVRNLGWRGWVSMELFNRSLEASGDHVPPEHARRGMKSWGRLVADFPAMETPCRWTGSMQPPERAGVGPYGTDASTPNGWHCPGGRSRIEHGQYSGQLDVAFHTSRL